MRVLLILSLGICVLSTTAASAASDLAECSANGVRVSAEVTVGYDGVGSTAADFGSVIDTPPSIVVPNASGIANAVRNAVPSDGLAKDVVVGDMTAYFEYGTPYGTVTQDTLLLKATGMGSAMQSTNIVGNNADAIVQGKARVEFFIDIVAGEDCDTFFQVPAVRNLALYETFLEINVIFDPGLPTEDLLVTLSPGSPAQNVLLPEDHSYLIQLEYDYRVPYGNDPPFDFEYLITVGETPASPVPLLGPYSGIALGLLLLASTALAAGRSRTRSLRAS